jgi:hypothetical protein
MARRSTFPLRLDPKTLSALRAWADDELRSLNGQIEYLLRHALRDAGRLSAPRPDKVPPARNVSAGDAKSSVDRARDQRNLAVGARE